VRPSFALDRLAINSHTLLSQPNPESEESLYDNHSSENKPEGDAKN
jgi:hypothetical protein